MTDKKTKRTTSNIKHLAVSALLNFLALSKFIVT